jgi:DNA-binding CsgD family transcriptional regulator
VASLSGFLAEGIRRAIVLSALPAEPEELDPGLIVLADDDSLETANLAAHVWLEELGMEGELSDGLPLVVHAVAGRARVAAAGNVKGDAIARARLRTRAGRWVLVQGSMLGTGPDARVAVILEAANVPELAPLIADAYGLTEREQLVTCLVAQGLPTSEIADRLHLSPYTVQDHLKSIFEKTGVSTRGELVACVFFDHYAPRLASGAPLAATGWFAPT